MEQIRQHKTAKVILTAVLTFVVTLAMIFAILPATTLTAYAAATELAADTVTWENGYYVVPADGVTISGQITVNGTVNLILTEGATLTANKGITLSNDAKLKVKGTGTMVVNGTNAADFTSEGFEDTAGSGSSAISGGGTLIWNSGTLTAKGGKGGNMNDYGPECKAGQGASAISCALTVNGGTLTATGGNGGNLTNGFGPDGRAGNGGAGISGALTVNGGTVTATGGDRGTKKSNGSNGSIGMGVSSTLTLGANVKLYEGTEANDEKLLDGDDGSSRAYAGDKKQSMYAYGPDYVAEADKKALNNAIISAETIYIGIKSNTDYADIASTLKTEIDTAKAVADNVEADQDAVDMATINLSTAITAAAEAALSMIGAQTTWENETYYVPKNGATIAGHITVNGTVNLILPADATLTASAGITLSEVATLNISGNGTMVVNGSNGNANSTAEGAGTLILKSGTLTVKGGTGGSLGDDSYQQTAGVGGAAINGDVIVNGGTLTATGGTSGNLGSYNAYCKSGDGGVAINGAVTVNGGTMTAAVGARGSVGSYPAYSSTGAGGAAYSGTLTLGKNVKLYEGTEANDEKLLYGNDGSSRVYEGEKKANMFAQGTDKSALNDAIIEAEFLYYSIKDNTDYSDIATTIKTALDTAKGVADNIEADQDAVDTAATALDNALKEAKDTKAVIDEIKDLPESTALTTDNYTTYKDAINQADTDYNALSEDAQGNVPDALQSKLEACKAVIDSLDFAAYKEAQKTEADNKAQAGDSDAATALITAAKKAIDDLTYDTSKPLEQNKAAVTAVVTQLTTDLADQRAADPVIAQINALPATDSITPENKDAIEAARKAYDDLTDDQKAKVSAETLQKLTDAETALAAAQKEAADTAAANSASDTINALPAANTVTTADKDAIEAARAAYNALTADQKAKVSAETLQKLTDAETALAAAQKEAADTAAANAVKDKITAIGTVEYTTVSKGKIDEARTAYDGLTDDQKALVDNYVTLTTAETTYAAEKKTAEDNAAANAVKEKIAAIGTVAYTTESKGKIDEAKAAYEALTADQKALVDTYETLTTAESTYNTLKADNDAADEVKALISAIGTVEYTTESKDKIDEARAAYNGLTEEQKTLVDNYATLTTAETTYAAEKKTADDNAAANAVKEKIAAIGTVEYTTESKGKIDEAKAAYEALTADQKALVDTYETLTIAESTYNTLKADNDAADAVKALITAIGTVEYTTESKGKIDEAKAAYEALTADQKALVDTYETLTTAESTYNTLKADNDAANEVKALVAAIGDVAYSTESKAKIDAAREAYDALTDEQKALVTNYGTLTSAEGSYANLKVAKEAEDAINALPASENIAVTDKATVAAAQAKYNALTPAQKEIVSAETVAKLAAANNMVAVQEVVVSIGDIDASNPDSAKVTEARAAYDALTDEQKAKVTNYESLTAAESKLIEINNPEKKGLSGGAIAGIVIAFVVVLGALGALLFSYFKQKKAEKK